MKRSWMLGVLLLTAGVMAWPQTAKPATAGKTKAMLTGCVTRSAAVPDALVLRSKESCSQLAGAGAKNSLVGHEVSLEGKLDLATADTPETLHITAVTQVGGACTQTCTLEPPGKRGLRKKEIPAGKASTPGMQADPRDPSGNVPPN